MTSAFRTSLYLVLCWVSSTSTSVNALPSQDALDMDVSNSHVAFSALHRRIPLGRFRPSEEEFAEEEDYNVQEDFNEEMEHDPGFDGEEGRELAKPIWQQCKIVLDNYLGKYGVERKACRKCQRDPKNWRQFILTCDFSDLCEFCSPENDACYTLTHEYKVRPWRGRLTQVQDIAYSACGIMHDGGEKVCLDETYKNWGHLNTQCVSVDGVSCRQCQVNNQCGQYKYDCRNIEPGFIMDSCDYSFNDLISKESVFVGFNYGLYEADTTSCFAKDGNPGNLHRNLRGENETQ